MGDSYGARDLQTFGPFQCHVARAVLCIPFLILYLVKTRWHHGFLDPTKTRFFSWVQSLQVRYLSASCYRSFGQDQERRPITEESLFFLSLSPKNLENTMSTEETTTILEPWIVPCPHAHHISSHNLRKHSAASPHQGINMLHTLFSS